MKSNGDVVQGESPGTQQKIIGIRYDMYPIGGGAFILRPRYYGFSRTIMVLSGIIMTLFLLYLVIAYSRMKSIRSKHLNDPVVSNVPEYHPTREWYPSEPLYPAPPSEDETVRHYNLEDFHRTMTNMAKIEEALESVNDFNLNDVLKQLLPNLTTMA